MSSIEDYRRTTEPQPAAYPKAEPTPVPKAVWVPVQFGFSPPNVQKAEPSSVPKAAHAMKANSETVFKSERSDNLERDDSWQLRDETIPKAEPQPVAEPKSEPSPVPNAVG